MLESHGTAMSFVKSGLGINNVGTQSFCTMYNVENLGKMLEDPMA